MDAPLCLAHDPLGSFIYRQKSTDVRVAVAAHRVARVDLSRVAPAETLRFSLAWSPETLRLMIHDRADLHRHTVSEGQSSETKLWVNAEGCIAVVGSAGLSVMGARAYAHGSKILSPPALELWAETREAARVLLAGDSPEGYLFEVVAANAALGMLVTGLETYCKERFVEIEGEGMPLNAEKFLARFGTPEEREQLRLGNRPVVIDHLRAVSKLATSLPQRVNFQNYDNCKRAFSAAYGVRFGVDLRVRNLLLERIQLLLFYRHRVIHVSPIMSFLNQPEVPPQEPEFSNRAFAVVASATFDEFVRALHAASLRLRPPSGTF